MPKQENHQDNTLDTIIEQVDAMEADPDRHLSVQIDDTLREAVRAAQTSAQQASVTLKITIKPGAERRVSFGANVSAKLPRPNVSQVTMYADKDGNIHKSDPAQLRMPFTPKKQDQEV